MTNPQVAGKELMHGRVLCALVQTAFVVLINSLPAKDWKLLGTVTGLMSTR